MKISAAFDSGNIEVIDCSDNNNILLSIRKDNKSEFKQWFYFCLTGQKEHSYRIQIINAGDCTYSDGWKDYKAVASYDGEQWFRINTTSYDGNVLTIEHTPEFDTVYYAYFAPYTLTRHRRFIESIVSDSIVSCQVVGNSLDGRDIDLLVIGEPAQHKKVCWFIGRQHPGETMGSWFIEGLTERLISKDDPVAINLLEKAVFYIVPNINPDGTYRGHLRTNAVGINLNREWDNPNNDRSPEVVCVRNKMFDTDADFVLDVHGIENFPYCFILQCDGSPHYNKKQVELISKYKQELEMKSEDFQTREVHPLDDPSKTELVGCSTQLAHRLGAIAMTFEQPFGDALNNPNSVTGWSPERAKSLGAANLLALHKIIDSC